MKRIVVEVATPSLPSSFRFGPPSIRARHAPILTGACVLELATDRTYEYLLPEYADLWTSLRQADEIITWNGNRGALLVLRRLFGAENFPITKHHVGISWGRHIDLCEVIEESRDFTVRVSLPKAIHLTLGERLKLKRPYGKAKSQERMQRCRLMTKNIGRLWRAYHHGDGMVVAVGRPLFAVNNPHASPDGSQTSLVRRARLPAGRPLVV